MKIRSEESLRAAQVGGVSPITNTSPAASGIANSKTETPAATVSFSAQAQDISKAKAAVAKAPDVREDFVKDIKARVNAGTYKPSGTDIAEMMLRRHEADQVR